MIERIEYLEQLKRFIRKRVKIFTKNKRPLSKIFNNI